MFNLENRLLKLFLRYQRRHIPREWSEENIIGGRERLRNLATWIEPSDCMTVAELDVNGRPAEWLSIKGETPGRTILYLHGGGYLFGSRRTHRTLACDISRAAGARTLLIDYRLAPEDTFPAPVEDATAAYRWLLRQGHDPDRIIIAGDSAGGGLTLATLIALRDAADPLPAAAVSLSPWVDLTLSGETIVTKEDDDPWLTPEQMGAVADIYLDGADPRHPLASPLLADLRGLPPLLLQTGTAEILLSDSLRLAEKAEAAGVDVTLEVWEGMVHVWHMFAGLVPESTEAIVHIGRFIKKHAPAREAALAGV